MDVVVVGLSRGGVIQASTGCDERDAPRFARYYRGLRGPYGKRFASVRILTYEELRKFQDEHSPYKLTHS